MKTSIILIVLILLNTTVLVSEPLAQLVKGVNTWLFVGAEIILLVGYYINQIVKDVRKVSEINFSDIKFRG